MDASTLLSLVDVRRPGVRGLWTPRSLASSDNLCSTRSLFDKADEPESGCCDELQTLLTEPLARYELINTQPSTLLCEHNSNEAVSLAVTGSGAL